MSIRKHSGNTGDRLEARLPRFRFACLLLAAGLVFASCSAGGQFEAEPSPTPSVAPAESPTPTELPFAGTQTAESADMSLVIERVVLSTAVDDNGAPVNEVSVLSQEQQNIYLAIRARHVPANARFQAIWYENDEVIGQSDAIVEDSPNETRWISLRFRPIAQLNPASQHSVELIVNDRPIDSYAFRVGVGNPADIIAEAALALEVDQSGRPVNPTRRFDRRAGQIILATRISNMVDPTGMIFTAQWMRGDILLYQGPPDNAQPDASNRNMTFTYRPEPGLTTGNHTVILRLNGTIIGQYRFEVVDGDAGGQDEETPSVQPTPTTPQDQVELIRVVVAESVNRQTSAPDAAIQRLDVWPTQVVELFIALEFEDLKEDNNVEIITSIGNSVLERIPVPREAIERGWIALPIEFRAPDVRNRQVTYEINVRIDDVHAGGTTITLEANQEIPPPTPTPGPSPTPDPGDQVEDTSEDDDD